MPAVFADVVNIVTVVAFDLLILYFWGLKSLIYLAAGNIFGGGLHPMAGHLIAEHYTFVKVSFPLLSTATQQRGPSAHTA